MGKEGGTEGEGGREGRKVKGRNRLLLAAHFKEPGEPYRGFSVPEGSKHIICWPRQRAINLFQPPSHHSHPSCRDSQNKDSNRERPFQRLLAEI